MKSFFHALIWIFLVVPDSTQIDKNGTSSESCKSDLLILWEHVKSLQQTLANITSLISDETAARCSLQAIVKNHMMAAMGKDVENIQWPNESK